MNATNTTVDASTDALNKALNEMMDARESHVAGDITWTEYRLRVNNAQLVMKGISTQEKADKQVDELRERGH